jgi:hypothetical protein
MIVVAMVVLSFWVPAVLVSLPQRAASSVSEDTDSQSLMREVVPISDFRPCGSRFVHMTAG